MLCFEVWLVVYNVFYLFSMVIGCSILRYVLLLLVVLITSIVYGCVKSRHIQYL